MTELALFELADVAPPCPVCGPARPAHCLWHTAPHGVGYHVHACPKPCPNDCPVHVLMPCMGFACGEDMLSVPGHWVFSAREWDAVTCSGCLHLGPEVVRSEAAIQQGIASRWPR